MIKSCENEIENCELRWTGRNFHLGSMFRIFLFDNFSFWIKKMHLKVSWCVKLKFLSFIHPLARLCDDDVQSRSSVGFKFSTEWRPEQWKEEKGSRIFYLCKCYVCRGISCLNKLLTWVDDVEEERWKRRKLKVEMRCGDGV